MGVFPNVGLKDAREKRRSAKIQLSNDQDPSEVRKEEKRASAVNRFEDVARQWWEHNKESWSHDHGVRVLKRLEDNAFKDLGHLSIDEITPKQVIATIRKVEARGALVLPTELNSPSMRHAVSPSNKVLQRATPQVTWMASSNNEKFSTGLRCLEKSFLNS